MRNIYYRTSQASSPSSIEVFLQYYERGIANSFKEAKNTMLTLTITQKDGTVSTLTEKNVKSNGFTVNCSNSPYGTFDIGSISSNSMSVRFLSGSSVSAINFTKARIDAYYEVLSDEVFPRISSEKILVGVYFGGFEVDTITNYDNGDVDVICYDTTNKMSNTKLSDISFLKDDEGETIQTIAVNLFVGGYVHIEPCSWTRTSETGLNDNQIVSFIQEKNSNYTLKDLYKMFCSVCGKNMSYSRMNGSTLTYKVSDTTVPGGRSGGNPLVSVEKEDRFSTSIGKEYVIKDIRCSDGNLTYSAGGTVVDEEKDRILDFGTNIMALSIQNVTSALTNLLGEFGNKTFCSGKISSRDMPWIEPGDIIYYRKDSTHQYTQMPCVQTKFTMNGGFYMVFGDVKDAKNTSSGTTGTIVKETMMTDWVIEDRYYSGVGRVRKWKSGRMEQVVYKNVTISNAQAWVPNSNYIQITWPVQFYGVPYVTYGHYSSGDGMVSVKGSPTATQSPKYYYVNPNNTAYSGSFEIDIYAVGNWK